ncbi:MAG: DNA gyrase/topoisomerase IV subunit A [Porphyromonadaceae bacterium]|nr:DNA gyrase/topoisomerase IV subunit A [Porphyromonadaceae bacterium]
MAKDDELNELEEQNLPKDELNNVEGEVDDDISGEAHSKYIVPKISDEGFVKHHLSGMYQTWFLDYASYVILERAVPDIYDGLKPVQRRILHSMRRLDDGRYNKVANIVGHTMQFHPHGDASIGDALVQLGQKDLLIDCQGNWGNILTGDGAAAPRYIEARLSKFALETVFNPKTTEWKLSYDGRNKEPITLPIKFPLLLAQGVEGIAVGLNSKILPHNFNELLDASIAYLRGKDFELFPDFQTGGSIDVSRYNDGERGGSVKVRAKISKLDNRTLVINELPFGTDTSKLIDSIIRANDKGKIKIRKVDDNTAENVEILVHLVPGSSSDKTIDALYAFTGCEASISPNCCVIHDKKPRFIGVSDLLKISTDHTKNLLKLELEIQRDELLEQLFFVSLEKIFIENRIYKDKEFEESSTQDEVVMHIDKRIEPFKKDFIREVTREDILKLLDIKMVRITKFDSKKADDTILGIQKKIKEIEYNLENIIEFTIFWFQTLKDKYGKDYPRKTEIRNFDTIIATKVVEASEKLYVNHEEGFIGTGLKKDEFVCNCSNIDDIIVFFKDGKYKIVKVAEKLFVGKNILFINVFKKNDKRTIYNTVYRHGKTGPFYIKRFAVTSITRDREYDLTRGEDGSRVLYFSANPNAEAEVVRVTLKPRPRLKNLVIEKDFSDIAIKGRQSQGNILTKNDVHRITLKQKGGSTLGGREVWFDRDVRRLNYDERGDYLGEFFSDDLVLVLTTNGEYRTTNFDLSNHFESEILTIKKFDPNKVWTVALYDADQDYYYLKRFQLEPTPKLTSFLGENPDSKLMLISGKTYPRIEVIFGGEDEHREPLDIDAEEFIGVKGFRAKGKRITTYNVAAINELEPIRSKPESKDEDDEEPVKNGNELESEESSDSKIDENKLESDVTQKEISKQELEDKQEKSDDSADKKVTKPIVKKEESKKLVKKEAESKAAKAEPEKPEKKKAKESYLQKVLKEKKKEIIDQKRIIDDITGQMSLFD